MSAPRLHYGLQHDLDERVRTHLFVLCPNNSGSTFLKNALGGSRHTWNLAREGQRTFGDVGPDHRVYLRHLVWAARSSWIRTYANASNFDWPATRRAWYAQAVATSPEAPVFVEKSPPHLLIADALRAAFANARFLIMVRDPYATYEGIIRRRRQAPPGAPGDSRTLAAEHVVACLDRQRSNRRELAGLATFFSYERLCADPRGCAAEIAGLVPELADPQLDRRVAVKGLYDEPLRNMNAEQVARLST